MAYTQNINDMQELLKPIIFIPTIVTFIVFMVWAVSFFIEANNKMIGVILLIVTMLLTVGVMSVMVVVSVSWEMRGQNEWPETIGEITVSTFDQSSLTTRTGPSNENNGLREPEVYTPHVEYRYEVAAKEYTGNAINGPLTQGYDDRKQASAVLEDYPVGGKVPVYYSPRHPATSVLEKTGVSFLSLPLIVGILFILAGLPSVWVLSIYIHNGEETLEGREVFEPIHKWGKAHVSPIVNNQLENVGRFVEAHPGFKNAMVKNAKRIIICYRKLQPRFSKPEYSKGELKRELALCKELYGHNEFHYLSNVAGAYQKAHYYTKAIETYKKLMEMSMDSCRNNWYIVEDYSYTLAQAGKVEEAEQLLREFAEKWKAEIEKEKISVEKELTCLKNIQPGKWVE